MFEYVALVKVILTFSTDPLCIRDEFLCQSVMNTRTKLISRGKSLFQHHSTDIDLIINETRDQCFSVGSLL